MARNILSPVRPAKTGATVLPTAATVDGDAIPPDAALWVNNASAGTITLTVVTPAVAADNLAIGDYTLTIPAAGVRLVGPFPEDVYRQQSGTTAGLVHIDYSAFASVTRVAIGGFNV